MNSNVVSFGTGRFEKKHIDAICKAAQKCSTAGAERMLEVVRENRHRNVSPHAAFIQVASALYNREFPDISARRNILDAVNTARERLYSVYAVG